jgi:hypothetical protein
MLQGRLSAFADAARPAGRATISKTVSWCAIPRLVSPPAGIKTPRL